MFVLHCVRSKKVNNCLFLIISNELPTTTGQRQAFLNQNFGFECHCDKCKPLELQSNARAMMMADPFVKHCLKYHRTSKMVVTEQFGNLAIDFLKKFGHLPWLEEIGMALNVLRKLILDY